MNRLTHERSNGIKTGYWSPSKKEELVQRLAAYEDTGLEPEEILGGRMRSDWILTEEELPADPDEVVLVQISGSPKKNIFLINAQEIATYSEEEGWMIESYPEWKGAAPVAWMLLPEIYRAGDHDDC